MRIGVMETIKPDLPQHIIDAPTPRPHQTARFQAQRHVLPYRAPWIKRRILKHQDAGRIGDLDLLADP